jgi:hypothetical protein
VSTLVEQPEQPGGRAQQKWSGPATLIAMLIIVVGTYATILLAAGGVAEPAPPPPPVTTSNPVPLSPTSPAPP